MTSALTSMGWLAAAFALSWLAVWAMSRAAARLGLLDYPNHRSLHAAPVPRGGGAGFVMVFAALLWPAAQSLEIELSPAAWRVLAASLLVATISLADDRFGLPALARLVSQSCAAMLVAAPWIGAALSPGGTNGGAHRLVAAFGAILGIVAVTNFYNFMDGADGLAAGQAVLMLVAGGVIALADGGFEIALLGGLLAASIGGFLPHNWHPAAIFMGDAGSTFLGFLFAALAATAAFEPAFAAVSPAAWLCLLLPFLWDTTATLAKRFWRGACWHQAHREHFYQRLIRSGWSHRRVTTAYLSVTAVLAVITVAHFGFGAGTFANVVGACFAVIAASHWIARRAATGNQVTIGRRATAESALEHSLR